jgi:hypothetical protein
MENAPGLKQRSGEGDGVTELFELADESVGGAFGVVACEVVAAEVALGHARRDMCQ